MLGTSQLVLIFIRLANIPHMLTQSLMCLIVVGLAPAQIWCQEPFWSTADRRQAHKCNTEKKNGIGMPGDTDLKLFYGFLYRASISPLESMGNMLNFL
ncbi:hypothetical protein AMECASPLE_018942 [Ameca splendens]|uniref:Secreted protein n=1 Tax=Ameca splendens TaxID=208324 RepID=A0ABV0Z0X6_9TELE